AASIPRRSAAPYPTFIGTVITRAPFAAAMAAVPSVLPSSMTMTSPRRPSRWSTSRTEARTVEMAASSLCAGITKVRPSSAMRSVPGPRARFSCLAQRLCGRRGETVGPASLDEEAVPLDQVHQEPEPEAVVGAAREVLLPEVAHAGGAEKPESPDRAV